MADERLIKAGDHFFRIAKERGFRTIRPLTEEPGNRSLLKRRGNPATLVEGDVVVVPAFEPKDTTGAVNRFNTFTVAGSGTFLNLFLEDTERRPLANRAFRLVAADIDPAGGRPVAADPIDDVTGPKGDLSAEIPAFAIEAELTLHATDDPASAIIGKIKILIGVLESADTIRGQQARLNNMGYFAGFSDQHLEQLRWAIEEFQADHKMKPTGRFDDPETFNRIAHEHGDLLKSQRVP